jgi:hypothetical protein
MRSACRSNCASTPGSRITPCAHPHLPGFVHHLYIPGFGWGLWELGSDMMRHQTTRLWEFPAITCFPWHSAGFVARLPPINTSWEDARSWGIPSLGYPPSRMTAWGSHHLYLIHMFYLYYIIVILSTRSKNENNYLRNKILKKYQALQNVTCGLSR